MDSTAFEVGHLVKETQSVLRARMDEELRPLGLTLPQYVCLETLLEHPGATSSEVARRGFVTRQTLNVLVKGLVERGLVDRATEPGPRRQLAVTPTDEARELVTEARRRVGAVAERMTARLDADQLHALRDALVSCRDALTTQDPGRPPGGTRSPL